MEPTPLNEALANGPVGFTVGASVKADVGRIWAAITEKEHLAKFFDMLPEEPMTRTGRMRIDWNTGTPDWVEIREVVPNEKLVYEWNAYKQPYRTTVTYQLTPKDDGAVHVQVSETGWELTQDGVESSLADCEGWTQFVVQLRFYLEHGIV